MRRTLQLFSSITVFFSLSSLRTTIDAGADEKQQASRKHSSSPSFIALPQLAKSCLHTAAATTPTTWQADDVDHQLKWWRKKKTLKRDKNNTKVACHSFKTDIFTRNCDEKRRRKKMNRRRRADEEQLPENSSEIMPTTDTLTQRKKSGRTPPIGNLMILWCLVEFCAKLKENNFFFAGFVCLGFAKRCWAFKFIAICQIMRFACQE